ncbi:MAG: type I restriction endonuclease subunit R, partial [Moorella sp. (in: Bacteria)]|nr:type I restriction endonuclease subunit R [Moorella sp. (in: firmicutes)]
RKTAKLVQEHSVPGAIRDTVEIYTIDEHTLEMLAESNAPDTVKVFNLIKSIGALVEEKGKAVPYLFSIGEMAEEVARRFQERQITTQEALEKLKNLIGNYLGWERERAEKRMAGEPYTVYWLLKEQGGKEHSLSLAQIEETAARLASAFEHYPHWRKSEHQNRSLRVELYRTLREQGIKNMAPLVRQIMNIMGGRRNGG